MLPEHLNLVRTLSAPTVRPDGSDVVFCVSRPDTTDNRYHSALWRLATSGRGITVGPILLGLARSAHILTPTASVRRIVNMTALTAVDAAGQR